MSAPPVRCSICATPVHWSVSDSIWVHRCGVIGNDHAAAVSPTPESEHVRSTAEAAYAAYCERIRRADEQRERAFESWRRGLEG